MKNKMLTFSFKEHSVRSIYIVVVFFACLICIVFGGLVWNDIHISRINLEDYSVYENSADGYLVNIDSVNCRRDEISITKDYVTIEGWAINQNVSLDRVTIDLILTNSLTNESLVLPTTMVERTDVTDTYGNGEKTYDWSGFSIRVPYSSRIDTEKYDYEILIRMKVNDEETVIIDSGKNTGGYK